MVRKSESLQKVVMKEIMRGYLKNNDISIKNGTDVNALCETYRQVGRRY